MDIDVNRIQISVRGGSHHIHLYRPLDSSIDVRDHTEVCNGPIDFGSWGLVVATQNIYTDWGLPPGVAFHFRAGQQLLMQTHFNNVGSLETIGEGKAVINLHTIRGRKFVPTRERFGRRTAMFWFRPGRIGHSPPSASFRRQ